MFVAGLVILSRGKEEGSKCHVEDEKGDTRVTSS